jgi:hypothetical protein
MSTATISDEERRTSTIQKSSGAALERARGNLWKLTDEDLAALAEAIGREREVGSRERSLQVRVMRAAIWS